MNIVASQETGSRRTPFGARRGQRITSVVLLVIVSLLILFALFGPVFPVANPRELLDIFGGGYGNLPFLWVVSITQWLMLCCALGLTIWFLAKRWVAFYIPLAAGLIAAVAYWLAYALVRLNLF